VARSDSSKCGRRREVGLEAARRLKEILRAGAAPGRTLPPLPPPPSFEERRPPMKLLRRPALDDDEQDE
jgi:hypothetical protein